MRLTITDVARAAGVSTATVDRALNERTGVRARTRRRVLTAAQRLGYLDLLPATGVAAAEPAFIVPGGTNTFFDLLSTSLSEIARRRGQEARIQVHRMEAFHSEVLAAGLREMARHTDGIGLIALDHPAVRTTIREAAANVRVVTLVSDIADVPRDAYVGIDNRAAGRLAGHLLGRFLQRPGPIALFAGSLSYREHEERARGFRRILAEEFPELDVIETVEMRDDVEECHRIAAALLHRVSNLAGIYNTGAGNRGIVRALEEAGCARQVAFIGYKLTEHTRRFLLAGTMDAVIDQDLRAQAIFRENMD